MDTTVTRGLPEAFFRSFLHWNPGHTGRPTGGSRRPGFPFVMVLVDGTTSHGTYEKMTYASVVWHQLLVERSLRLIASTECERGKKEIEVWTPAQYTHPVGYRFPPGYLVDDSIEGHDTELLVG
jgi:hypothetical protein